MAKRGCCINNKFDWPFTRLSNIVISLVEMKKFIGKSFFGTITTNSDKLASIDTHQTIKNLTSFGLDLDKSQGLTNLLNSLFQSSYETHELATRESLMELQHRHQTLLSAFSSLHRNSLNSFVATGTATHNSLLADLRLARQKSRQDLHAIRSDLKLDFALERGRSRDAWLSQTIKLQDLSNRLDTEIGNGMTGIEKLRHEILYSALGVLFTSAAAFFGYLRYFK